MIGILPKKYIEDNIGNILTLVEKTIKFNSGELTLLDIKRGIESDLYGVWGGIVNSELQSVIIVNLVNYPSKKVLNIMVVVSENMDILRDEFLGKMELFAKENSCDSIYLHGREGWKKVLEPYGYKQPYIVLERKL